MKSFDWKKLLKRNVLGCNAAFYLGAALVPFTVFGDIKFIHQHRAGLDKYTAEGGAVVTNASIRAADRPAWIKTMPKVLHGLDNKGGLGWNGNTGATAINLALLMGASTVYLLGYDMKLSSDGAANFHNAYAHQPNARAYQRFLKGMDYVGRDLPRVFPGRRVVNLEDRTSALNVFPKESLKAHFGEGN